MIKTIITSSILFLGLSNLIAQGAQLFDDSFLHEIHFDKMDTLLINGQKKYQMVNMTFDGLLVDSIGIKDKGNISSSVPNRKLPLKIKTNKYVSGKKYDGIKEFTLHNNFQDPTMMREKLTYDMCAAVGLLSLRTAFAKVYINGRYWGLYTIVEGKDEFFKQQFDYRDADAIESLDFGKMCYISDNPNDYDVDVSGIPYYQHENGDKTSAFLRFAAMIDKANNTVDEKYISEVSNHLNLEDFFKYQAINVYLMNFDSYLGFNGNQIYMYDTTASIWQVIPWDFNASLNLWDDGNGNQQAKAYPLFPDRITNGCIAGRLTTIPELKDYYLTTMCELVNEHADTANIIESIDFFKNQIQSAVHDDWRKTYTNQAFDETTEYGIFNFDGNQFEGLKTFFMDRYAVIRESLVQENVSCETTSLIDAIGTPDKITIFPNPAKDYLNINHSNRVDQLSIYALSGKLLVQVEKPNFPLHIAQLNSGIYVVSFLSDNSYTHTKVVIH